MKVYKFIKIRGYEGARTGYFVPHLYELTCNSYVLERYGFRYIKERLNGWTIWWVENEDDYTRAIQTLEELKKTRLFEYKTM